jgi:hypothetical protein
MFFPKEHLHSVLGNDLPATHPPGIHLRTSVPYDLSKKEGVAAAIKGMLGLRRYLLSGEAKVESLRRAMMDACGLVVTERASRAGKKSQSSVDPERWGSVVEIRIKRRLARFTAATARHSKEQ